MVAREQAKEYCKSDKRDAKFGAAAKDTIFGDWQRSNKRYNSCTADKLAWLQFSDRPYEQNLDHYLTYFTRSLSMTDTSYPKAYYMCL